LFPRAGGEDKDVPKKRQNTEGEVAGNKGEVGGGPRGGGGGGGATEFPDPPSIRPWLSSRSLMPLSAIEHKCRQPIGALKIRCLGYLTTLRLST